MINEYENGGLKMIDLESFNKALKSSWIKKYLDKENKGKWKLLFDIELQKYGKTDLFRGNLSKNDFLKRFHIDDTFVKETIQIWTEVNYDDQIRSIDHFQSQKLWNNSLIKVENQPIYYRSWSLKGIEIIKDVMKDETTFLTFPDFQEKFDIKTNFLLFYGLIASIKSLRKLKKNQIASKHESCNESFFEKFKKAKKPNRIVYQKLVTSKQSFPKKSQEKWCNDCNLSNENMNWKTVYKLPFRCTNISKLIIFQFNLLQRRLATNDFLNKIGVKEDFLCTFCKEEKETLIHIFWLCKKTQDFWKLFDMWLKENKIFLKLNTLSPDIILGIKTEAFSNNQQYLYTLVARYYIWICRSRELSPRIEGFRNLLESLLQFHIKIQTNCR